MMDPMSKDLHTYLSRLEEQQRQVCCKMLAECTCQVGSSPAIVSKQAVPAREPPQACRCWR